MLIPIAGMSYTIYTSRGVKKLDGSYYEDDIVMVGDSDNNYCFVRVEKILYHEGHPYLYCKRYNIVCYSIHYHCYEIKPSKYSFLIDIDNLQANFVLGMYEISNKMYVPLKFHLPNVL